ncbi:SusC/RagA family TonB-linked outer membrane protein [Flavobacterium sp. 7A]|uniref:SusC/RagA family TonB-linked outer membrane protein n=1 Tax=Flavobacterium sp. 7A TaxID=2940571 RepID=UPI002227D4DD|nr:TonB-dependent receptor [Flavobacterium sp. 7A]MCW2118201.1 TonB-linked SusC/RagA family outer membrane protein [Flavobacterium sp. 7A]
MQNKKQFLTQKLIVLVVIAFLCCQSSIWAQKSTIQGVISSTEDGLPIPGATILVKGTKKATNSNLDGQYLINAKIGDVVRFSYLGFQTQNIKVTSTTLNVALSSQLSELEEVVVIGYGTVKKKELTGAVSQVKAKDIDMFVNQDIASSLQGQIAGVNVTAVSGEPGESSSIQIRGISSLGGTNTPLFVVDGIPQQGDPRLSPSEIETIDVLKDAASAAVYGTRGAAGVILITTKKGKSGKVSISLDVSSGFQILGKGVPLMNTNEKIAYELALLKNNVAGAVNPGPHRNPDWLNNDNSFDDKVLINGAQTNQYVLNVSGGAKNFSYNVVGGYFSQDGLVINSGFKRYNGRANTSYNDDKWTIAAGVAFSLEKQQRANNSLITNAIRTPSYYPEVELDSDVVYTNALGRGSVNNLALSLKRKDRSNLDRINTNLSITRSITKDLNFVTRLGAAVINQTRNVFSPQYIEVDLDDGVSDVDPTKSFVQATSTRRTTLTWDGSLNYKKKFGNHSVGALATMSLDENTSEEFTAYKQGVINNNIEVLNGATINPDVSSGFNFNTKILGYLGRLQYNYKGKYLLSGVIRKDGSSKFAKDYRWGVFPSASGAWNISDEGFWKKYKKVVNNLKLRMSYGTVGNESFSPYEYNSNVAFGSDYIFSESDTDVNYGAAVRSFANAEVRWETSIQKNIGLDISMFKNKVNITADYYDTRKKDMLFPVRLPGSAGAYYDPILTLNVGDMTNKGLELSARLRERIGKSNFNISATFTKNTNEITRMTGDVNLIYNSNSALLNGDPASVVTALAQGYEAGAFFLYQTNGVIQNQAQLEAYQKFPARANAALGDLIYVDYNGDGDITEADRHYLGSGLSDFEVGFNLKWDYKNFDFYMNWYGTVGSEIMNGSKAAAYATGNHKDLVNQWTTDNPTSQIPLNNGDNKSGSFNYRGFTDQWLESGDYIRLKLVSVGYSIPSKVVNSVGISNLRIFLSAQNPLTLTKYSGFDPEVGGNNVARRGVDASRYPLSALYTIGVKLKF